MNTRTTVTLNTHLIDELMDEVRTSTKAKAVVLALQDFLRRRKLQKLDGLRGKLHFNVDAADLRKLNERFPSSH